MNRSLFMPSLPIRRAHLICAALLAAGLLPAAAQAAAQELQELQLTEVVVTAQKRSESLQRVPVSVTALTEGQLGQSKFDTASVLAEQVPNLQINGVVGEATPIFSLRGVSMFDFSFNQSSPVAAYEDEVYKGNFAIFGVELFDLERVEVLRGPQGTLYGKNTTGGAINLITKKPGFTTEGYFKAGMGNYGRFDSEGALQGALIPSRLAARVAYTYAKADGWFKNKLAGEPDLEGVDQWGVRVGLRYVASESVDADLTWSMSRQNPQNYGIFARPGPLGTGAGTYAAFNASDPVHNPQTDYFRTGLANDEIEMRYTDKRRQDTDAVALRVNWTISPGYAFSSISSYDSGSLFVPEGTDGAPIDVLKIPYYGRTRQFTQDFRLTSSLETPFNFILGTYYQHEVLFNTNELQFYNGIDFNGDGVHDFHDCEDSGGFIACRLGNRFDQNRNSWAVYTDTSYQLTQPVKLRLGLRYTNDNGGLHNFNSQLRGVDEVPIANLLPGDPNNVDATLDNHLHNTATTGKVGVDYTPTKDTLLYASYSRGYRSGAFNAQAMFAPEELEVSKPETLDAVEVGFKTEWLDNKLTANGAIFHYDYKNQQILDVSPVNSATTLVNLKKSKIKGAELELVARPTKSLLTRAGLAWLDAKFDEATLRGQDISGNRLQNAPKFSGTLAVDWQAVETDRAGLTVHVDGSYQSKQYLEPFNVERLAQGGYALLNARLSVHTTSDNWEVGLWGRNLTDRFYFTTAVDSLAGFGFDYFHRSVPRTYGLDATYRF